MLMLKNLFLIFSGFSSGIIISGAVFAFITIIGVVPRLAQKTGTQQYVRIYEEAIVVGGIFGASTSFFEIHLPIGHIGTVMVSICIGIFVGCLAASLAEVLNVIPIMTRRARLRKGMFFFVLAIALGKLFGSLIYCFVPGFRN